MWDWACRMTMQTTVWGLPAVFLTLNYKHIKKAAYNWLNVGVCIWACPYIDKTAAHITFCHPSSTWGQKYILHYTRGNPFLWDWVSLSSLASKRITSWDGDKLHWAQHPCCHKVLCNIYLTGQTVDKYISSCSTIVGFTIAFVQTLFKSRYDLILFLWYRFHHLCLTRRDANYMLLQNRAIRNSNWNMICHQLHCHN